MGRCSLSMALSSASATRGCSINPKCSPTRQKPCPKSWTSYRSAVAILARSSVVTLNRMTLSCKERQRSTKWQENRGNMVDAGRDKHRRTGNARDEAVSNLLPNYFERGELRCIFLLDRKSTRL